VGIGRICRASHFVALPGLGSGRTWVHPFGGVDTVCSCLQRAMIGFLGYVSSTLLGLPLQGDCSRYRGARGSLPVLPSRGAVAPKQERFDLGIVGRKIVVGMRGTTFVVVWRRRRSMLT
jgi:hypothetical protein